MKKFRLGLFAITFASLFSFNICSASDTGSASETGFVSDNVLVVNGSYQIPVQAAIALEQLKYDYFNSKDWKAEAISVMRQSLLDLEHAQMTVDRLVSVLVPPSNNYLVQTPAGASE